MAENVVRAAADGRFVDILIVKDDPDEFQRLERMLQNMEDIYRLHAADSVESALRLLSAQEPQITLLDLSLPDSQGVETIRTLHRMYPLIPIIVLLGHDNEQMMLEAAAAGAHDCLIKEHLTAPNLWRVVRYALERRSQEEQLRTTQAIYRHQARELNLLNRIISAASASSDEQEILHDSCFELALFYGTLRTLILLRHEQITTAAVKAEHFEPPFKPLLHEQLDLRQHPSFTAVSLTGESLILPALPLRMKNFLSTSDDSKAIILPLFVEEDNIGYFLLNLPSTHKLSANDVQLVATITKEIGLALEKIRLNDRLLAYTNELEDRVKERTQELAKANKRLKSLDKLKSKFVSDVSHELRNPITNLTLYLELLEFAPPGKQSKYFSILRDQVRRLANLVEEILTLARLENKANHHLFQPVDLNYLVQQIVVAHTPRAQSKQIKLHFAPVTPLPPVWGEPNQITQIVTNLLDNALNYTARGSIEITTSIKKMGDRNEIVLGVSDTGMGIQERDLPYIFDRFYRGSQVDRDAIVGTGLGLGIVSEIVELHDGRIEVQSRPNEGTWFTVTLPAAPQEL